MSIISSHLLGLCRTTSAYVFTPSSLIACWRGRPLPAETVSTAAATFPTKGSHKFPDYGRWPLVVAAGSASSAVEGNGVVIGRQDAGQEGVILPNVKRSDYAADWGSRLPRLCPIFSVSIATYPGLCRRDAGGS